MLLIDVDVLGKCAHWDMLSELPTLLGIAQADMATVSSFKYRAARASSKPDGKLFLTVEAAARAAEFVAVFSSLPEPDAFYLAALANVSGIDPGEAILFSVAASNERSIVLTGDKRAISALGASNSVATKKLNGRIIVMEQVVRAALEARGINWLRDHICRHHKIDKAIAVAMGSGCDASENSVKAGLISYIGSIRRSCGALLREI